MVERVARAIFEDYAAQSPSAHPDWGGMPEFARGIARSNARAAIRAMREPTEAMIAAQLIAVARLRNADMAQDFRIANSARHVWQAMIDAALKEPPSS